ncbi:MAG: hypothetical protein DMD91_19475 [Candidatus Rokuibacteriota bacterium]|nr:MAG: hypothetical protein DMD91_19475 [Candidatus Rokubacteria bacterium]
MLALSLQQALRIATRQPSRAPIRLQIPLPEGQGQGDPLCWTQSRETLAVFRSQAIGHALHHREL